MLEGLAELDRLAETLTSPLQRAAVTVAAVAVLAILLTRSRGLQRWLADHVRPLYADIIVTGLVVGTAMAVLGVVLGTWGEAGEIHRIYADLDLGGEGIARGVFSLLLIVGTYIFTRFVKRVIHDVLESAPSVTDHQREVTYRVTQASIWAVAGVIVLGVWIDDLSSILIGAGVLGVVIGMAAQKTLGSIVSGFVLMFSRPFEIGDWIEVEDHEGIVSDISIVNTRIQSFDGEYVIVPNDVISSDVVINRSKRGRLRIEIEVGVDYTSDIERAQRVALEAVEDLEHALSAPTPRVATKRFADSAVVLGVRFWIDAPTARRRNQATTDGVQAIKAAFQREGVKIPFPQRELSGRAETDGFRVTHEDEQTEQSPRPREDD